MQMFEAFAQFETIPQYLFVASVILLALLLIRYVHLSINRVLEKRLARIDTIKRMDPLHTDLLSKKAKARQREAIAERIDKRFSIIRRVLLGSIGLVAVMVGVVPFVGSLPTTFISLLLTGFTVVLGIAARPFVENMISGVVISLSNQIRVGDTLYIDKQYGTVEDILVTHTRIKTWDWKRYLIPNSRMLTKEFVNLTLKEKKLWSYLEFYVSYEADIERVERIAVEAAFSSEYCSEVDEPQFWVIRMERDAILCWIAAWAESPSEAWALRSDMAKATFAALRREGIKTNITNIGMGHTMPFTGLDAASDSATPTDSGSRFSSARMNGPMGETSATTQGDVFGATMADSMGGGMDGSSGNGPFGR